MVIEFEIFIYIYGFFPLFQRMVISLSSDKDVWNAVLNNEAVRELKESFNAGWLKVK